VELWETRPRISERKSEEDGTTVIKEVVLDHSSGKPIIDKKLRGVSPVYELFCFRY